MARPNAMTYLAKELKSPGFTKEWLGLPDADKADLRRWAEEEMDAFGLTA